MASDSNQGNILITGATGNVGFEIVKQLSAPADRNTRLRAAVRSINDAAQGNRSTSRIGRDGL